MKRSGRSESLKNNSKKIIIEIPSQNKYIKEVSSKILKALSPRKIDEGRAFDIKLCVEEAVRNAILHGNNSKKDLSVKVSYWFFGGNITIEVEDKGKGYTPELVPDPTKGENIMKGSGRGVYLIKRLMDEIEFNDKGNKIRMVKRLS